MVFHPRFQPPAATKVRAPGAAAVRLAAHCQGGALRTLEVPHMAPWEEHEIPFSWEMGQNLRLMGPQMLVYV